jgi:diguanylate cyclase (GGDEF)-like protein
LRQARVGVLFASLDNFKAVNEAHEHTGGDQLLQAVTSRLQAELRETDTAARFGGDKFAVLAWDVADPAALTALADKLAACLVRPYRIDGSECRVGVSIGQALFPDAALEPEALIELAESGMHEHKREQRADAASAHQGDLFA